MTNRIIPLAVLLACAPLLHAQTDDAMSLGIRCLNICNEDPVYGSARYSAMAGARMALGEDISAIRENPAGLGLYMHRSDINITPDFSAANGVNGFTVSSLGGAFRLGNNHKAKGYVSSAVGVSYNRVNNYASEMEFDGGSLNESKSSGIYSVGYGMNIGNRQFYGIGINIIRAHYLEKNKEEETTTQQFDTRVTGFNLKVGAVVKLKENLNVAAAFHSPTRYNMVESVNKDGETVYDKQEYHEWAPLKLEAGIGWNIRPTTTLSFDYSYQDFKAMNVANSYDYYNDVKDYVENNMKTCHTFKAGFEAEPMENIKGRLGVAYATSPTDTPSEEDLQGKNIDYAVLLPKGTLYVCAGVGYTYHKLYADFAYVLKNQKADFFPEVTSANHECTSESRISHDLMLTIGAHF